MLRDGLEISIQDLEMEKRKEEMLNKGLLVLRFTKASCDAFISMAADFLSVIGGEVAKKQAEAIEAIYGAASPVAEAASSSYAGQKVDWVKTGADSIKKGVSLVTKNEGYRIATKSAVVKVEIIKSAMNGDKEGLLKSAASYLYDLHTTLGDLAENAGVKRVSAFAKIAKDAFEYNEKTGEAFEELLQGDLETQERYHALKTTLIHQARRLSATIDDLDEYITSCDAEIKASSGAATSPIKLP
jgi:hypothetical protein